MSEVAGKKIVRPLSPHLQVYKPQLTTVMSILHRMTGAALCVGTLMIAWWLVAAMLGEGAYNTAMNFSRSPLGLFMLFGWTFCLYYHIFNGIRHLLWDAVLLFKLKNAYRAGYVVLLLTVVGTIFTWVMAVHVSVVNFYMPGVEKNHDIEDKVLQP